MVVNHSKCMMAASSLIVRTDRSIARVLEPANSLERLYVDLRASSMVTLVISDIVLTTDDNWFGVLALEALRDTGILGPGVRVLRFVGVGRTHGDSSERKETVRRHDEICEIAKAFSVRNSLRVINAYITMQSHSLNTNVFLEPM